MSSSVDQTFITLWSEEAKLAYQQETSLIRNSVRTVTGNFDTYKFPKLGKGAATRNKARFADLQPMDLNHSSTSVTIVPVHAMEPCDDMDLIRTNQDLRAQYTRTVVAAVSRELDKLIIEALAVPFVSAKSKLSISNALNSAGIIAARKAQSKLLVPTKDRFALVSAGGVEDIQSDTKFTSRDYVGQQIMETGMCPNVFGYTVIEPADDVLTVPATNQKTNYFFHKDSVGLAIAKDIEIEVVWLPLKQSWAIIGKLAAGAVVIDNDGVEAADIAD